TGIGEDATIVLRTRRPALMASVFVILASALTVVAISVRHPAIVSAPEGETMPASPIRDTAQSAFGPMGRGAVDAPPPNAPTPPAGRANAPTAPGGRATSAPSPSAAPLTEVAGSTPRAANTAPPTAIAPRQATVEPFVSAAKV